MEREGGRTGREKGMGGRVEKGGGKEGRGLEARGEGRREEGVREEGRKGGREVLRERERERVNLK